MAKLNFYIRKQEIQPDVPRVIVSDTVDYLTVGVKIADADKAEWAGKDIWLHFCRTGENPLDIQINGDTRADLPAGHFKVYAHAGTGTSRITTNNCEVHVEQCLALNGSPLPALTPSASEQISYNASQAKLIAPGFKERK